MVLLVLVDYRYRFSKVNFGAPGRRNDSKIYNSSLLKKILQNCDVLKATTKQISDIQTVPVFNGFVWWTKIVEPLIIEV